MWLIVVFYQVVEGESAALLVGGWISNAYVDRLHVEVILGSLYVAVFEWTWNLRKKKITFESCGLKQAIDIYRVINHLSNGKMRSLNCF